MFRDSLGLVEDALRTYREMMSREASEFKGGKVVVATLIGEVLAKFESIASALSSLEEAVRSSGVKVGRACEGLTYVSDDDITALIHGSPLTTISFSGRGGRIALSSKHLTVSLGASELEIRYRGRSTVLRLGVKDDILESSAVLKALTSESLNLINYASALVESCRKKVGGR